MRELRRTKGIIPLMLAVSLLGGCAFSNRSNTTELQADENGKLIHTIIEKTDKSYTVEELEQYIEDQIAADAGGTAQSASSASSEQDTASSEQDTASSGIELQSCRIKDGIVQIRIDYSSYRDYMRFNGTRCFFGTVAEAEAAGYSFDRGYLDEKGREAEDAGTQVSERASEWKCLIVEEPMRVRVPDKILYTSENMKATGRMTAAYTGEQAGDQNQDNDQKQSDDQEQDDNKQDQETEEASDEEKTASDGSELDAFIINDFDLAYVIFK